VSDLRRDEKLTTSDIAAAVQAPPAGEGRMTEPRRAGDDRPPETVPISEERPASRRSDDAPLFPEEETGRFRAEWDGIQSGFVDEPRQAVESADELVARTMKRLAEIFADERARLEAPWSRGEQVSTEDLRLALQRYRSFFGRLLSA
jgi:hypothetical protein